MNKLKCSGGMNHDRLSKNFPEDFMTMASNREFSALREKAALPKHEIASRLGVSIRQVSRYESGDCEVPKLALEEMQRLASGAKRERKRNPRPKFRFIDLFAGIGGMRLGLESVGGKCVFTSEWDKYAQQTYRANFDDGADHLFAGDIREVPSRAIPEHDVLAAGFPCQPFSLAGVSKKNALGRPHGFDCETQGTLFFEVERIIRDRRPVAFLLENVKNLERHDKGRTFRVIMDKLTDELGYETVEHRVISSHPWVPQKRERIFIVGFAKPSKFDFGGFDALVPVEARHPRLGDILQSHNEVSQKYTLTEHLWGYLKAYREKHEKKGNGFGYSLFGPDDVTRTLSARYYKDGSEILIAQRNTRPRRLTPIECARLMGFETADREWRIPVSDTQAYKQFGNAVVVPVVESVAKLMEPHIMSALRAERRERKLRAEASDTQLDLACA